MPFQTNLLVLAPNLMDIRSYRSHLTVLPNYVQTSLFPGTIHRVCHRIGVPMPAAFGVRRLADAPSFVREEYLRAGDDVLETYRRAP